MLTGLKIINFKCFQEETALQFSRFNVLYGKNGRGKSSSIQPLLLLSQNVSRKESLNIISLKGSYVELGGYYDVINRNAAEQSPICFELFSDDEEPLTLKYSSSNVGPTLIQLDDAWIGRRKLMSSVGTQNGNDGNTKNSSSLSGLNVIESLGHLKYVSANRRGPANYENRKDDFDKGDIGAEGERIINALAKCGSEFLESFQEALSYIMDGAYVKISNDNDDRVELFLDSNDSSTGFKPKNVGYGYSYVLPIIYQILSTEANTIVIIENPEAHLYPGAQSRLVEWLVCVANVKKLQIILETHSDHIINGLRISVKTGKLDRNDVMIQFVDRKSDEMSPVVKMIQVDQNGTLSEEPADFMDEWTKQMLALL